MTNLPGDCLLCRGRCSEDEGVEDSRLAVIVIVIVIDIIIVAAAPWIRELKTADLLLLLLLFIGIVVDIITLVIVLFVGKHLNILPSS